ncbi:MAG: recombinase family protein, partial [Chitinophagaceae bacterium]
MMKQRAFLYVRVSTDEQAEKGYSQKHQDDRLKQYCAFTNIEIAGVYWEDYSAKTFDRPEFKKLLAHLKKHRNSADLLLFLKWDRFSRNIAEAYAMINQLNKLGIEPQAIEQPLDLDIPENKIMLAFYLAAPEVENDRRSLNTIAGMRRAMREGRHVNMAPKGYKNARDENENPIIIIGKDAPLIKWAFEEIARGVYNVIEVWKMAKEKGLDTSKAQIWNILRNPFYCGRLFIPAYKDEKAMVVPAIHEAIISEILFDDVQDVLNGRKRKFPAKNCMKEELPLRGNLICRKCGGKLTGSASKGNGGRYFYYHCTKGCNERFKADEGNKVFKNELVKYQSNKKSVEFLDTVLVDYTRLSAIDKKKKLAQLGTEIKVCQSRINSARQLMLDGKLDTQEYREIKNEYEGQLRKLEAQLVEMDIVNSDLKDKLQFCRMVLVNLAEYYAGADLLAKKQLAGSIYPEKLIIDEFSVRTTRVNEAISPICRPVVDFSESKNEDCPEISGQSYVVPGTGFEPAHPFERCHL